MMRTRLRFLFVAIFALLLSAASAQALTSVRFHAETGCYVPVGGTTDTQLSAAVAELTWDTCLLLPRTKAGAASGNWTLAANLTIPARMTLRIPHGVIISPNAGKTLTIAKEVDAGYYQIFDADGSTTGTVVFPLGAGAKVKLDWWGADPTGVTADTENATNDAIGSLTAGGILTYTPGASYRFGASPADITVSGVYVDCQWATLHSSVAATSLFFTWEGDSGTEGDYSSVIVGGGMRNCFIGTANDATNEFQGPRFSWCEGCIAENIIKRGQGNTAFNAYVCQDCVFRNIWNIGCADTTHFGMLLHMSNNTLVDNFHVSDGPCTYGLQVKGGTDNIIQNSSAHNLTSADAGDIAFRNRGDAPWKASSTSGITYPFATIGASDCTAVDCWASADPRRASIRTTFKNIRVVDSTNIQAYEDIDSYGTQWRNISADTVKSGLTITKSADAPAAEREYLVDGFHFRDCGVTASTGDAGRCISTGSSHSTFLQDVTIKNGIADGCDGSCINIDNTTDAIIQNVVVKNAGQGAGGTGHENGLNIEDAIRPLIDGVVAYDDDPGTQDSGIYCEDAVRPKIVNSTAYDNTTWQIRCWFAGTFDNNNPGDCTAQTTDATVSNARCRLQLETADVIWIEATAVAKESTTNRAVYKVGALFYETGGSATQQGSDTALITAIESDATWGGLTFAAGGLEVRVEVQGVAATTIDWVITLDTTTID